MFFSTNELKKEFFDKESTNIKCSMTSPFQPNIKNQRAFIVTQSNVFLLSVKNYEFHLQIIRSDWNTDFIELKIGDTKYFLERSTLIMQEAGEPNFVTEEYDCNITSLEDLLDDYVTSINVNRLKNKI